MSMFKCPANGMMCIQGCGCCVNCRKTQGNVISSDCACGFWRKAKQKLEAQSDNKNVNTK